MRQQNVKSPDVNAATLPRPLSPAAAALGKVLSRAWSLPPQRNQVAVERDVQVPMSDGAVLLADHYLPVSVASANACASDRGVRLHRYGRCQAADPGGARSGGANAPIAKVPTPESLAIEVVHADVRDARAIQAAVSDVDAVCHLAALSRVRESFDGQRVPSGQCHRHQDNSGCARIESGEKAACPHSWCMPLLMPCTARPSISRS